jgi:nickel-dependent lactate racemase
MEYASQALMEGGVMILLAECRDGFGHTTFFDWFRYRSLDLFEAALRERYEINGQTAYSLLQKAQHFTIILVSRLPDHQVENMGMIPARSLEDAVNKAEELMPPGWRALVMPEGGSVLPVPGIPRG